MRPLSPTAAKIEANTRLAGAPELPSGITATALAQLRVLADGNSYTLPDVLRLSNTKQNRFPWLFAKDMAELDTASKVDGMPWKYKITPTGAEVVRIATEAGFFRGV